jgi:hypothetical protein
VPIIQFLQRLVAEMAEAPDPVQRIFASFMRLTKDELWNSEDELRKFIYADGNYDRLLKGEIGINLIQTHTAMSLAAIDEWTRYIFRVADEILAPHIGDEEGEREFLADVKTFCAGRTHNIWGATADDDNPTAIFHYDVDRWIHAPLFAPLSDFKLENPESVAFGFPAEKQIERAALMQRYGTTPTGIGRIIIQMGRNRIWREPLPESRVEPSSIVVEAAARRWAT